MAAPAHNEQSQSAMNMADSLHGNGKTPVEAATFGEESERGVINTNNDEVNICTGSTRHGGGTKTGDQGKKHSLLDAVDQLGKMAQQAQPMLQSNKSKLEACAKKGESRAEALEILLLEDDEDDDDDRRTKTGGRSPAGAKRLCTDATKNNQKANGTMRLAGTIDDQLGQLAQQAQQMLQYRENKLRACGMDYKKCVEEFDKSSEMIQRLVRAEGDLFINSNNTPTGDGTKTVASHFGRVAKRSRSDGDGALDEQGGDGAEAGEAWNDHGREQETQSRQLKRQIDRLKSLMKTVETNFNKAKEKALGAMKDTENQIKVTESDLAEIEEEIHEAGSLEDAETELEEAAFDVELDAGFEDTLTKMKAFPKEHEELLKLQNSPQGGSHVDAGSNAMEAVGNFLGKTKDLDFGSFFSQVDAMQKKTRRFATARDKLASLKESIADKEERELWLPDARENLEKFKAGLEALENNYRTFREPCDRFLAKLEGMLVPVEEDES